jgi:hypothetical protein
VWRAARAATAACGFAIEPACGVEQRGDVVGAIEVGTRRLHRGQPPAAALRRVAADVAVLDGELEDRRERRQALIDRRRVEPALPHLRAAEAVDVLDPDLVEPPTRELRQ